MDYNVPFDGALGQLRDERCFRVFADLEDRIFQGFLIHICDLRSRLQRGLGRDSLLRLALVPAPRTSLLAAVNFIFDHLVGDADAIVIFNDFMRRDNDRTAVHIGLADDSQIFTEGSDFRGPVQADDAHRFELLFKIYPGERLADDVDDECELQVGSHRALVHAYKATLDDDIGRRPLGEGVTIRGRDDGVEWIGSKAKLGSACLLLRCEERGSARVRLRLRHETGEASREQNLACCHAWRAGRRRIEKHEGWDAPQRSGFSANGTKAISLPALALSASRAEVSKSGRSATTST